MANEQVQMVRTDWMVDRGLPAVLQQPIPIFISAGGEKPTARQLPKQKTRIWAPFGGTRCFTLICQHCRRNPVIGFGVRWNSEGFEAFSVSDAYCHLKECADKFPVGDDNVGYNLVPKTLSLPEFSGKAARKMVLGVFRQLLNLKRVITVEYVRGLYHTLPLESIEPEDSPKDRAWFDYGFRRDR